MQQTVPHKYDRMISREQTVPHLYDRVISRDQVEPIYTIE